MVSDEVKAFMDLWFVWMPAIIIVFKYIKSVKFIFFLNNGWTTLTGIQVLLFCSKYLYFCHAPIVFIVKIDSILILFNSYTSQFGSQ